MLKTSTSLRRRKPQDGERKASPHTDQFATTSTFFAKCVLSSQAHFTSMPSIAQSSYIEVGGSFLSTPFTAFSSACLS